MKNLTRVLALVLVFSLVLGTVAFAAFTDVESTDDYAEAIETLAAFGIIQGYEDGTFGADKAITRAEAVAIVNRIQNLSDAASGAQGASLYTDVAADHWALGDINLATQMGIISGDGNGLFRPEDQVSYQEMVKMLVVALGYQPAANDKGGWPTGYLVVASQYGILEDTVNGGATPATRGVVAQLTFNALTAPTMEQTGFGDNKSYEVQNVAGARKTILTEKLSINKIDVTPVANDVTYIEGNATCKVGYVKVKIPEVTGYTPSDNDSFYGVKAPFALASKDADQTYETFVAGTSTIGEQLGYSAVAYIKQNADKEWEVIYSTVEAGKNTVVEVDPSTFYSYSNYQLEVRDDDTNLKEKYDFDANTRVIINDEAQADDYIDTFGEADFQYDDGSYIEGTVKLLYSSKSDDVVDYIFIDKYYTDRVSEESPSGKTIELDQYGVIRLDKEENKNLVYTLKLDGEDVEPSELQEGDIVTFKEANDKNYYEILVSRATVEGTVDATYEEAGTKYYEVAGKDYEASVSAIAGGFDTKLSSVRPGSAGTFYLDVFGKIAYFDRTSAVSADKNFGFVNSYGQTSSNSMNPKFGVEILATDGSVATYNFANKVTVTTNSFDGDAVVDDEGISYTTVVDQGSSKVLNEDIEDALALAYGKLFDYTLNSSGDISAFTVWSGNADSSLDEAYFTFNGEGSAAFNERKSSLGNFVITDDTVVFYVGEDDSDDYAVTDKSFFYDDEDYTYLAYCTINGNSGKEVGAIVITSQATSASQREDIAVFVKSALVKNTEGVTVSQLSFYQNGELVEMMGDSQSVANGLNTGDVFEYDKNAKGEITSVTPISLDYEDWAYPEYDSGQKVNYVYGQVYDRTTTSVKLGGFASDNWDTHIIPDTANVYMVDYSGTKVTVSVSSIKDVTKNRYTNAGVLYDEDDADNFMVCIKYNEDDVIGVVIYKNMISGIDNHGKPIFK